MNRKGRRRCHRCHMQLQLATASAIDNNNIAITAAQSKLWTGSNCRSYRSIYAQLNAAIFLFTPSLLLFPPDWQTDIGFGLRWLHCASSTQFTLWFQSIESSTSTRLTSRLLSYTLFLLFRPLCGLVACSLTNISCNIVFIILNLCLTATFALIGHKEQPSTRLLPSAQWVRSAEYYCKYFGAWSWKFFVNIYWF